MIEKFSRPLPDYSRRMYEDGYEPWEILAAAHNKMIAAAAKRQAEAQPLAEDYTINIKTETKVRK